MSRPEPYSPEPTRPEPSRPNPYRNTPPPTKAQKPLRAPLRKDARLRLQSQFLLLTGFLVGGASGIAARLFELDLAWRDGVLTLFVRPVEQLFLGALILLIGPLLASATIRGVSRLRATPGMAGLLARVFVHTLAISAAAALIGLAMANLFRPGEGIPPEVGRRILAMHLTGLPRELPPGLRAVLPDLGAVNWLVAGMILGSFLVSAAISFLRQNRQTRLVEASDRMYASCMRVLGRVMYFAPLAVACFMFDMTVLLGWPLLLYLGAYILVVLAALLLQICVTFFIVVWMCGAMNPARFLAGAQEAALIAFSTSSSNATLPTALRVAKEDLALPDHIAVPILGIGTLANQSGTTIYLTVTFLFVSQFFGFDVPMSGQALVFLVATLAGMGTVGVPAGGLPALATMLALFGLPPEGIGLVVGVERLLDMARTLVNVTGDLAIAVALNRSPQSEACDFMEIRREA